jgi:hypothetical protein
MGNWELPPHASALSLQLRQLQSAVESVPRLLQASSTKVKELGGYRLGHSEAQAGDDAAVKDSRSVPGLRGAAEG